MLPLLNVLVVQILVLATLLILLFGPLVAIWIALSIRRSLARIADANEKQNVFSARMVSFHEDAATVMRNEEQRRVSNSAFGR